MTKTITDALNDSTFAPLNHSIATKIDRNLSSFAAVSARHEAARARKDSGTYTARNTYKTRKAAERAAKKITDQIDADWGAGTTQVSVFEVTVTERKKITTENVTTRVEITRPAFVPVVTVCVASCWAGYLNDSSRLAADNAYHNLFGSFFSVGGYGVRGNVEMLPFGRN